MEREEIIARVLDHAGHPRGKTPVADANLRQAGGNPGCGDVIVWTLRIDDEDKVVEVGWQGKGCNLSQAGASMLSGRLEGRTLPEVIDLPHDFLVDLIGPQLALTRPTCSSLALNTIKTGAYRYLKEHGRPVSP